ncbi:tRNA A-37 threonylcarbamoyl transferase component Bud32 [Streptomyces sp. 846.5]|nr:phosphotransferase [Streptomyces sp. 846.5]TDU01650.1 tRNA A-37 threonylcarbamoyl transferase component Bud32 [Streptomyces sp. 846.5]
MDLELLGSGRDADVYVVDDARVLRRFRHGGDVASEARFMRLAGQLGYPAPQVFSVDGPDIVMQRLAGPTMLGALLTGAMGTEAAGTELARLHRRLHQLPVPADSDGPCLLHLDLHPDNVMLTESGPVVIDWTNAAFGAAGLDVAVTSLLFGLLATDTGSELAGTADALLTVFLQKSVEGPLSHLDAAVALRDGDPNLTAAERSRFGAAVELIRARSRPEPVQSA